MMICKAGEWGVSKTYHLTKEVLKYRKKGYFVITNYSCKGANIDGSRLTPDEFLDLLREVLWMKKLGLEPFDLDDSFKHTGIFIAMDEGHLYFTAESFKSYQTDPRFKELLVFLSQCRKQGVHIVYTVQDFSKIDINWRKYTGQVDEVKPMIPLKYRKKVPHKRAEGKYELQERYIIPLVWVNSHKLDAAFPHYDYSTYIDQEGNERPTKMNTVKKRRIGVFGWLDPFPYTIYDSYQIIGTDLVNKDFRFKNISSFDVIPYFGRERFRWLKVLLGKRQNDYYDDVISRDVKPEWDEMTNKIRIMIEQHQLKNPRSRPDLIRSVTDNLRKTAAMLTEASEAGVAGAPRGARDDPPLAPSATEFEGRGYCV